MHDDIGRLRRRFQNIKQRCYNPKSSGYKKYGKRGIVVCNEWLINPLLFIKWSLKNGFKKDLQIDRIDNDGPYSPENCRWTVAAVQQLNRRDTVTNLEKGTRICSKCKTEKPFSEFHKSVMPRDHGYQRWCKFCRHEYEILKEVKKK